MKETNAVIVNLTGSTGHRIAATARSRCADARRGSSAPKIAARQGELLHDRRA